MIKRFSMGVLGVVATAFTATLMLSATGDAGECTKTIRKERTTVSYYTPTVGVVPTYTVPSVVGYTTTTTAPQVVSYTTTPAVTPVASWVSAPAVVNYTVPAPTTTTTTVNYYPAPVATMATVPAYVSAPVVQPAAYPVYTVMVP
jgi:hypothetical protein